MTWVDQLSQASGINAPALRLLLSLLISQPLLWHFRIAFLPSSSLLLKHLYLLVVGSLLSFFNYGNETLHLYALTLGVYLVLLLVGSFSRPLAGLCVLFGSMTYLLLAYSWKHSDTGEYMMNYTIPMCVMVLRLIGLGFDYMDGGKGNGKRSPTELKSLPNVIAVFAYSFSPTGFLTGPQYSYSRFNDWLTLALYKDDKNSLQTIPGVPASSLSKHYFTAALYFALSQILSSLFPSSFLITREYAALPLLHKIFIFTCTGRFALYKYFGVWLLAESSCQLAGLAYKGKDTNGQADHSALANIIPWQFETTPVLNGIILSFNINTNHWSKQHIYKRLVFLGNKHLSSIGTLLFLAVWHGHYPGYYVAFSLEFLDMVVETQWVQFLEPWLVQQNIFIQTIVFVGRWVTTSVALAYAMCCFDLLTWSKIHLFLQSTFYFGHVAVLVVFLLGLVVAPLFRVKSEKKE